MAKKVTLADIAKKLKVSNVAVSKALSDKPGVSEELRNKIKETAYKMGYEAGSSKRNSGALTGNIGVIVPQNYYGYSISFYGQLYEKVVRALYDNKYYGILELLFKEDELAGNMPKVIEDGKVDGVIFLGQLKTEYVKKMLEITKVPVYFLDTYIPDMEFDTIISDGYYGAYIMTDYLIKQGFKRIGFVGSVDATSSIADRYWGYRRALREKNIKYEDAFEIPDRNERGETFEKIITKDNILPAYVCNCDYTAYRVMKNLEQLGLRVPEDVSIVGFDNFLPLGMGMDPKKITTYEVDMDRMAKDCVISLIKKIKGMEYRGGMQIITGKLVVKNSVKTNQNEGM